MDRRDPHAHVVSLDSAVPHEAKASVHAADAPALQITPAWWHREIGLAIGRVADEVYGSRKVAAAAIAVDAAEFGRWCDGTRRPHLDRLLANHRLRTPLLLALVQCDRALEVVMQVRHVERRRVQA